jgi:hypothetical protein
MSALSFRNVWVEYGEQIVLERINIEIANTRAQPRSIVMRSAHEKPVTMKTFSVAAQHYFRHGHCYGAARVWNQERGSTRDPGRDRCCREQARGRLPPCLRLASAISTLVTMWDARLRVRRPRSFVICWGVNP